MKKMTCKVCRNKFTPLKENKKVVSEIKGLGGIGGTTLYDAIDCPVCGCQNLLGVRMKEIAEGR